jgi:hypothetical protein
MSFDGLLVAILTILSLSLSLSIGHTWYFVSRVLQTPVNSIIATRNGMKPLVDMMAALLGEMR